MSFEFIQSLSYLSKQDQFPKPVHTPPLKDRLDERTLHMLIRSCSQKKRMLERKKTYGRTEILVIYLRLICNGSSPYSPRISDFLSESCLKAQNGVWRDVVHATPFRNTCLWCQPLWPTFLSRSNKQSRYLLRDNAHTTVTSSSCSRQALNMGWHRHTIWSSFPRHSHEHSNGERVCHGLLGFITSRTSL
jgi:hypothetical protein